ncbi:MAG: response regulator transcription factor [Acidimicrobiia bacterium]|nr:MAG: response regulator transcription factor [Acidimicrobiia bacterium]
MRIVLADDHRVVREGIRYMLSDEPDVEIVGEAETGDELLGLIESEPVDVVLLDVRMPGMSGFDALERLVEIAPQVRVLMLSMHDQPAYVRRAMELGAAGYVLKSAGRDELLSALRVVAEDGTYLPSELMEPLIAGVAGRKGRNGKLSPRESQVLRLVADGLENKQIAVELALSEATVKTYLRGVFERLEVSSRAEAVAVGIRLGVIE